MFYFVTLGYTGLYLAFFGVLLSFSMFYVTLPGFIGFFSVLLGFTGFYWVLFSLTGFNWVLLGSTILNQGLSDWFFPCCVRIQLVWRGSFDSQWVTPVETGFKNGLQFNATGFISFKSSFTTLEGEVEHDFSDFSTGYRVLAGFSGLEVGFFYIFLVDIGFWFLVSWLGFMGLEVRLMEGETDPLRRS